MAVRRHQVALLRSAIRDASKGGGSWHSEKRGDDVRVTVDHPDGSRTVMELPSGEWLAVCELLPSPPTR